MEQLMEDEPTPRRVELRRALAGGCGHWAPILPARSAPAEIPKLPPAIVLYRTHPKDGQECNRCRNFIAAADSCKRVEGRISPTGQCILWPGKA